ncbi:replication protein RepA [Thalassotalea sp. PLHSN55]|uniref:replication protein RepA n=1 Tax=Thalassotalea sp. PLHSN55 TaxID=3435888 RepID=UPI003F825D0B
MKNNKFINTEIIQDIENRSAIEAGAFRLYPIFLIDPCILPLRSTDDLTNGHKNNIREVIISSPLGLPYGAYSRLLIAYITTIAKQSNHLESPSIRNVANKCGINHLSGGKSGNHHRFIEQLRKVLALDFYVNDFKGKEKYHVLELTHRAVVADKTIFNKKGKTNITISFELSSSFSQLSKNKSFPIDNRVLIFLMNNKSPLAIDLYLFLAYKAPNMARKSTLLSWALLSSLFNNTKSKRLDNFKNELKRSLALVKLAYQNLNAFLGKDGLIVYKSCPHVSKKLETY